MRSSISKWLGLAAVGITLTGCVSQSEFKKVQAERDSLKGEVESARAEAEGYKGQLGAVTEQMGSKDEQITSLSNQNTELTAQLDEINRQYAEALQKANNPLPAALANELTEFASRNGDVLSFDAEKVIIKFKSDVSFPAGSVELTPKATEAIAKLSKILNEKGVSEYELMVAGHTDAMPVNRARRSSRVTATTGTCRPTGRSASARCCRRTRSAPSAWPWSATPISARSRATRRKTAGRRTAASSS